MAKQLCPNTTSVQTNYSAPVPFIGLYIAAATLVCFLLMLCDVIHGIRRRKLWYPCRFFALNSVTLTLVSIASKLPVDLTTAMPSAYDQLSKLTGTAMICVSMGYFLPSLGSNEASECKTNMAAMTILVVTVVVNICIQMSTGIIFSFRPELVIIMFCMLTVLFHLWSLTVSIDIHKEIQLDRKKELITNGKGSMLQRLILCYVHGYNSEPQFVLCKEVWSAFVASICFFCLVVVLQATFRSLIAGGELEFCNGFSDYGWSIRIIIFAQILVMLLANIATGFRFGVELLTYEGLKVERDRNIAEVIIDGAPVLKSDTGEYFYAYFNKATSIGSVIMGTVFVLPNILLEIIYFLGFIITYLCCPFVNKNTKSESIQEYTDLLKENGMELKKWTLRKCLKNIKIWTSTGSEKSISSSHVGELLSKRPPSQQSLDELNKQYDFKEGKEVSCLHLVFLVRLVSVSTPSALNGHLVGCLSEVFEVIYMVDSRMNSSKTNNKRKCKLAKAMWLGKDLKMVISIGSRSDLDHALEIIKETENVLTSSVWKEVDAMVAFIYSREYTSIVELYDYMEQLFVDMLHIFLTQLPHAIVKAIVESHAEEYEETAGRMLELLCQIKHLEDKVQWSFPAGINITSLITVQASDTNQHITSPMLHSYSSDLDSNAHVTEDEDQNVGNAHLHEIIQVE